MPGDEVHEEEAGTSAYDAYDVLDAGRARGARRHAAPRKPLLTRLHVPAGKAIAIAAMPSAVLMGMGLTPQLASAKSLPKSPFKPGPCVSQPDDSGKKDPDQAAQAKKDKERLEAAKKAAAEKKAKEADKKAEQDKAGKDGSSDSSGSSGSSGSGDSSSSSGGSSSADPQPSPSDSGKDDGGLLGGGGLLGTGLLGGSKGDDSKADSSSSPSASPSASGSSSSDSSDSGSSASSDKSTKSGSLGDTVGKVGDGLKDTTDKLGKGADDATGGKGSLLGGDKSDKAAQGGEDADGKKAFPCVEEKHSDGKDEQTPATLPNDPWKLEASSLALHGLDYKGVVNVHTADGRSKQALKFTADSLDIGDLHQIVEGPGGVKYHVEAAKGSTSTIRGGKVTLYTEKLQGNLFGLIPIVFDPEHPPPLNISEAYFTHVEVTQAGQFGGNLTVPGLHQYVQQ